MSGLRRDAGQINQTGRAGKPDLILTNGGVITLDPARPRARTVGIRAGRIVFVSSDDCRAAAWPGAEVIDCGGRTILPGFSDAHCHLAAYAQSLVTLNLEPRSGIKSLGDIGEALRRHSLTLPEGTWLRGRGYDEFHLAEKRHPTRWDLDRAAPLHPVKLAHRTGRAHVLNSLALGRLGITPTTPDPPEGFMERDYRTGEPTGLLYGMGGYLSAGIPPLSDAELRPGVVKANENLLAAGITSLQDASAGNGRQEWQTFSGWKKEGLLRPRLRMILGFKSLADYGEGAFSSSLPGEELAAGGVKIMIDETTGRLLPEQRDLDAMVLTIHRRGLQAVLHALEESAIEAACAAVEYALKRQPRPGHRHRIEHCAVCPPALAGRLAAAGIMAVTQPAFLYYHGERYLKTVPPAQAAHLYPLATLFRQGVRVAGSSDFPVAPTYPLLGIYGAVTRRAETGETVLSPEGISPEQALLLYTTHAAWSAFAEADRGSVMPGKLADLVVVSDDPTRVAGEEIKDIRVLMTIINGQVVWEAES